MSDAKILDFQAHKKAQKPAKDAELNASVSRHPAGKMKPVEPTKPEQVKLNPTPDVRDFIHLSLKDAVSPGISMTNVEEIEYHLHRLDAILDHATAFMSDTDAARLVKGIKNALHATAEVSYFEGLAEGYTADDDDLE